MSNGQLPIVAIVGIVILALIFKRMRAKKKKKAGTLKKIREGVEGALDDAEEKAEELRQRAKKLSGDAKRRVQEQAHEMDSRQQELRSRLEELRGEAGKLLERAKP